jgi:hypothetical protein
LLSSGVGASLPSSSEGSATVAVEEWRRRRAKGRLWTGQRRDRRRRRRCGWSGEKRR